jgi:CheY-like chemotaxis protein
MRDEVRRRQEEVWLAEEMRRKESALRLAEEQRKLEDMRHQVEELTRALEQEKNARKEISRLDLQSPAKQLREALEAAWINGAPEETIAQELHQQAISLSIPPDVEQSLIREVKLEMYSKAVKEVVAKRKLLRSSSSTLEWLRKVYQVSVAEYLENESKFLLDLVADQYKGTVLLVSKLIGTKEDITPRLKSSGFAVVQAITPENALEKIEKINPNIILCDAEFPGGLSGVKFLHVLRVNSKFNYIPFVLIGEAAEVPLLKSSELKSNEGVISQPIDYEELTNLMNEKLEWFREYISSLK